MIRLCLGEGCLETFAGNNGNGRCKCGAAPWDSKDHTDSATDDELSRRRMNKAMAGTPFKAIDPQHSPEVMAEIERVMAEFEKRWVRR